MLVLDFSCRLVKSEGAAGDQSAPSSVFINHSSIKTQKKGSAPSPLVIPSPAAAFQHERTQGVLSWLFHSLPSLPAPQKSPLTVPNASPQAATSFPTSHIFFPKEQWPNRTFLTSQPRNNPRHRHTQRRFSTSLTFPAASCTQTLHQGELGL